MNSLNKNETRVLKIIVITNAQKFTERMWWGDFQQEKNYFGQQLNDSKDDASFGLSQKL